MKVIVADDHGLVRDIMRHYIASLADGVEVAEAATLDEVMGHIHVSLATDLILLDLHMPGMNGVASVADVRKAFPGAAIVIISANSDATIIKAALKNGANGYIPKTTSGKALVTALRLVLDGETYVPAALLNQADAPSSGSGAVGMSPSNDDPRADLPGDLAKLSSREANVLRLLIDGKSNKEIARDLDVQEVTVKLHLRNVYRKIGAGSRTDAVRIALSQQGIESWLQSRPANENQDAARKD
jgi:DNA-binding NarL/FixJ family response regulator